MDPSGRSSEMPRPLSLFKARLLLGLVSADRMYSETQPRTTNESPEEVCLLLHVEL